MFRGGFRGRGGIPKRPEQAFASTSTCEELQTLLTGLDGQQYGAYKRLLNTAFSFPRFTLGFAHIQGDAYAPPSRVWVRVPLDVAGFPQDLLRSQIRQTALADFLTRKFCQVARDAAADVRSESGGWGGAKGGDIQMERPGQHVLPRTSVQFLPREACLEARFTLALPARGRTIQGAWCARLLSDTVPALVHSALLWPSLDTAAATVHVACVEDQDALRAQLPALGLVAFVGDGACLPRASGASDAPLSQAASVAFASPSELAVTVTLPNRGHVSGMGVGRGVTLIVGGGFHGKSTLLRALEAGVYNHVPGDGRELVVCDATAVKIRAEDGRAVAGVDISGFIGELPRSTSTRAFTTVCASGSTSQAANACEALEAGARVLLLDEDTCATNFMARDAAMAALVPREPITTFLARVRGLWTQHGVSSVLVAGSCGAFFAVADRVIMMDAFVPHDVSARASAVLSSMPESTPHVPPPPPVSPFAATFASTRALVPSSLALPGRVHVRDVGAIRVEGSDGDDILDLAAVEQLVEVGQTRAVAEAMQLLALRPSPLTTEAVAEILGELVAKGGVDALVPSGRAAALGNLSCPRPVDIIAAINRWRHLKVTEVK
jgi:predicted ABC-class ATPase